jgi:hypothetical protein
VFSATWHDAQALVPTKDGGGSSAGADGGLFAREASPNAASATTATPIMLDAISRAREPCRGALGAGAGGSVCLERAVCERRFLATASGLGSMVGPLSYRPAERQASDQGRSSALVGTTLLTDPEQSREGDALRAGRRRSADL